MPPGGPGGGGPAGGPGGSRGRDGREKTADKPTETRGDVHRGSGFGIEFPWVRADFTAEGKTYKDVGLRFKGNAGYMASAGGLKRPFKIDFNRFVAGQQFHGLKMVSLNANAMDPTRLREALSYAVFREAGVPAPRTAFVRLYVTIPGMHEKEFAGLYTLVENVDKTFLKDRFQTSKGLLLKPQGARGFEYLGEDWRQYEDRYRPKTDPNARTRRRLIEFAKLVNNADDNEFRKEIGSYLDVDEFLRFLAAMVLLSNLDSPLAMPQNYYLHIHPTTLQVVFLPWDLDLSFGSWPMGGTPEQQSDLSISHPHTGQNRLIERLLAIKEYDGAYRQHLKRLMAGYFSVDRLGKDIGTCEAVLKDIIAEEVKAVAARKESRGFGRGPGPGPMFGQGLPLAAFVVKRAESVNAQLAGKSKGFVSSGGLFGGPGGGPGRGFGPGGGPPGGFGPGMFLARPVLEAADANRDGKLSKEEFAAVARRLFAECDRGKKGSLDERGLAEGLSRLFPGPPGFPDGPPPGDRPDGPFVGGGPGTIFAGALMRRADADKDGKATLAEFVAAGGSLFTECDKDKSNSLEEEEIAAGINLLLPAPPGFGPPG